MKEAVFGWPMGSWSLEKIDVDVTLCITRWTSVWARNEYDGVSVQK